MIIIIWPNYKAKFYYYELSFLTNFKIYIYFISIIQKRNAGFLFNNFLKKLNWNIKFLKRQQNFKAVYDLEREKVFFK